MRYFFFILLSCLPFVTNAAPKIKMTKVDQKTYVETWSKANDSYKLQEYDLAIVGYKEAYRLSNDPDILLNMGRCYQKMKRYEDSLSSYRLYLKEEPTSPYKAELEAEVITKLEELMKQGSILVKVDQEEAQIYLGGNKKGAAPQEIKELAPGKYVLEVTKEGYEANSQEVTLNPNQALVIEVVLVPLPASIELSIEPEGAEIFLDGISQGVSLKELTKIPAGEHRLTVSKPKYKSQEKTITLERGGKVSFQTKLEIATGSIAIYSNVKNANVFLNGQAAGLVSPDGIIVLSGVPVGEHEIKVTLKSFKDATQTLELIEDKTLPVEVVLSGSPWPKAAYGFGAASGATALVFGLRGLLIWRGAVAIQEGTPENPFLSQADSDEAQLGFDKATSVFRTADFFTGISAMSVVTGYLLHQREEKQKVKSKINMGAESQPAK